jgi:hypothetical protein
MQSHVGRSVARVPKTFHEAGTVMVFCRGTGVMLIFRPPLLCDGVGISAVLDFHNVYCSAPDWSFVTPSCHKYVRSVLVPFAFLCLIGLLSSSFGVHPLWNSGGKQPT